MEALGRFVGGVIRAVALTISWAFWLTLALAALVAVIAIGAAIPPIWIIVILLFLIWLK